LLETSKKEEKHGIGKLQLKSFCFDMALIAA